MSHSYMGDLSCIYKFRTRGLGSVLYMGPRLVMKLRAIKNIKGRGPEQKVPASLPFMCIFTGKPPLTRAPLEHLGSIKQAAKIITPLQCETHAYFSV